VIYKKREREREREKEKEKERRRRRRKMVDQIESNRLRGGNVVALRLQPPFTIQN